MVDRSAVYIYIQYYIKFDSREHETGQNFKNCMLFVYFQEVALLYTICILYVNKYS